MKKFKIVYTIVLMGLNNLVQAQIEPMYGMYRFNASSINPAQAGATKSADISLLSRWQWTTIDGAPKTHVANFNTPYKSNVGFGINVVSDNIGPVSDFYIGADYSYQLALTRKTKVSAGLRLSLINHRVDLTTRKIIDQNDNAFSYNVNSGFRMNPGMGFLLQNPKFYVGLSLPRLLRYSYGNLYNVSSYKDVQHTFLYGGYEHSINREVKFRPSFILNAAVDVPLNLDVNATFTFKDALDLGLMMRMRDAIGLIMGYKFQNGIFVGYSYEYPISEIRKVSFMTHELAIRFAIKDYSNSKILTPRYFN